MTMDSAWDIAVVLDADWNPAPDGVAAAQRRFRPKLHRFAGGEIHVQLPDFPASAQRVLLAHRVNSSDNLLELLLAADAVRGAAPEATLDLFMPYIPYARQDRRMVPGDPLSIRVFANLINACGFGQVLVLDPHSDVAPALIDRCQGCSVHHHVAAALQRTGATKVVIPDAGAAKRVHGIMDRIDGGSDIQAIQAMKTRDVRNKGAITGMSLADGPNVTGESCLIVDDICDGGRTFLELSKLLRRHGAAAVHLYVTHGIFSHGLAGLLSCSEAEGRLDGVATTNSIRGLPPTERLLQFGI